MSSWSDGNSGFRPDRADSGSSPEFSVIVSDVMSGRAAEGIVSVLDQKSGGNWVTIARRVSDSTGTIRVDRMSRPGVYRIELDAEAYFALVGAVPLLMRVSITFRVPETYDNYILYVHISPTFQSTTLFRVN